MNESPVKCSENPVYETIDKPASSDSFHLLENTNQTQKSGHSSAHRCNHYEVNPPRGSKRAFFGLVTFVCLISLLVLLLTVLKFGSSNEGAAIETLETKVETKLENLYTLVENISMSLQSPQGAAIEPLETKLENLNALVENISMTRQSPPASSCKELYNDGLRENTAHILQTDTGKIPVYCHMTSHGIGECGGGGWTLVMKIDGNKQTFHYDADLWKNNNEFNLPGGETGFDAQETKLPTYWDTPFSKICVGMKIGHQLKFIAIVKPANSLYSLIADGRYRATSLGRNKWKTLIGLQASLQPYCNKEGFNAAGTENSMPRARIGILSNEQHDCNSNDSRIGLGTGGEHDDSNTCGNDAKYSPDNGDKDIKAMGYILVQ